MSVYNHDVVNSINQIPNRDTLTHEDLRVFMVLVKAFMYLGLEGTRSMITE